MDINSCFKKIQWASRKQFSTQKEQFNKNMSKTSNRNLSAETYTKKTKLYTRYKKQGRLNTKMY
jgi:hypothetical protein